MTGLIEGKYVFKSKKANHPPDFLCEIDIAFVGESVDDRGSSSLDLLMTSGCSKHTIRFEAESQSTYIDSNPIRRTQLADLLRAKQRILLDATTLGLGEILQLLLACKRAECHAIEFIYAEPKKYTQNAPDLSNGNPLRSFNLTKNCCFSSIQGFASPYETNMMATHVLFLGFEPGRIQSARDERGEVDREKYRYHVIVGMPAFKAGWESNTIRPHLSVLEELQITERSITYCQANSIRESYITLWELYRQLGDERGSFFVSPMGTKPHAVGAALFLIETIGNDNITSLYYDHPVRVGQRSSDIATWHHVCVELKGLKK